MWGHGFFAARGHLVTGTGTFPHPHLGGVPHAPPEQGILIRVSRQTVLIPSPPGARVGAAWN